MDYSYKYQPIQMYIDGGFDDIDEEDDDDDDDSYIPAPEPQKKSLRERYEEFTKKTNNLTPLSDILITDFDFDIDI
jgi:hypothetical protein